MTGSLLFVFAHPDDESFSGAGTAMKYGAAGVPSVLVTATLGERGKTGDPPVCRPEDLGAQREAELRRAVVIAGFRELHLLGYRDRELADVDPEAIGARLVGIIRRIRPAIVLTFDPNGHNQHPDHIAIGRFTSDAVARAGDPRWFREQGPAHPVARLVWTPPMPPWEAVKSARIEDEAGVDFLIDVSPWRARRAEALRAHRSQHLSVDKYFFSQPDPDRILSTEIWRQAWGPPIARPSGDLFDGVRVANGPA